MTDAQRKDWKAKREAREVEGRLSLTEAMKDACSMVSYWGLTTLAEARDIVFGTDEELAYNKASAEREERFWKTHTIVVDCNGYDRVVSIGCCEGDPYEL